MILQNFLSSTFLLLCIQPYRSLVSNDFFLQNKNFKTIIRMMGSKNGNGNGNGSGKNKNNGNNDGIGRGRNMAPIYSPRSENQKQYVKMLESKQNQIIFVLGPAGTGKTLFACLAAIKDLRDGNVEKIVLTRPVVTVEEELGFLPGNIKNKMDPWTRPIFDIFLEYYHQREIDSMIQSGVIEISPLAFMRGRTFKRCFILADEMQNSSPNQMIMLTTRIGYGSKMVINGDLRQSDLTRQNGLEMFLQKIRHFSEIGKNHTGIAVCSMKYTDIERSPVVSMVLEILDQSNISNVEEKKSVGPVNLVSGSAYITNVNNSSISNTINTNTIVDRSVGFTDAALIPLNYYKKDFTLLNCYITPTEKKNGTNNF